MIVDELANWRKYYGKLKGLESAFKFLEDEANAKLPVSRKEVKGVAVYALSQKYTTNPLTSKSQFEAHRKYIDIHYIVSGEELIEWAPTDALSANTEYNEGEDYMLYKRTENSSQLRMYQGYFAVLFPTDAHIPCCQLKGPCEVHKVVMKVSVDLL